VIWRLGRFFTRQIVFPYSVHLVQRQAHQFMNQKLASEMEKMLSQFAETIEHFMLQPVHKPLGY